MLEWYKLTLAFRFQVFGKRETKGYHSTTAAGTRTQRAPTFEQYSLHTERSRYIKQDEMISSLEMGFGSPTQTKPKTQVDQSLKEYEGDWDMVLSAKFRLCRTADLRARGLDVPVYNPTSLLASKVSKTESTPELAIEATENDSESEDDGIFVADKQASNSDETEKKALRKKTVSSSAAINDSQPTYRDILGNLANSKSGKLIACANTQLSQDSRKSSLDVKSEDIHDSEIKTEEDLSSRSVSRPESIRRSRPRRGGVVHGILGGPASQAFQAMEDLHKEVNSYMPQSASELDNSSNSPSVDRGSPQFDTVNSFIRTSPSQVRQSSQPCEAANRINQEDFYPNARHASIGINSADSSWQPLTPPISALKQRSSIEISERVKHLQLISPPICNLPRFDDSVYSRTSQTLDDGPIAKASVETSDLDDPFTEAEEQYYQSEGSQTEFRNDKQTLANSEEPRVTSNHDTKENASIFKGLGVDFLIEDSEKRTSDAEITNGLQSETKAPTPQQLALQEAKNAAVGEQDNTVTSGSDFTDEGGNFADAVLPEAMSIEDQARQQPAMIRASSETPTEVFTPEIIEEAMIDLRKDAEKRASAFRAITMNQVSTTISEEQESGSVIAPYVPEGAEETNQETNTLAKEVADAINNKSFKAIGAKTQSPAKDKTPAVALAEPAVCSKNSKAIASTIKAEMATPKLIPKTQSTASDKPPKVRVRQAKQDTEDSTEATEKAKSDKLAKKRPGIEKPAAKKQAEDAPSQPQAKFDQKVSFMPGSVTHSAKLSKKTPLSSSLADSQQATFSMSPELLSTPEFANAKPADLQELSSFLNRLSTNLEVPQSLAQEPDSSAQRGEKRKAEKISDIETAPESRKLLVAPGLMTLSEIERKAADARARRKVAENKIKDCKAMVEAFRTMQEDLKKAEELEKEAEDLEVNSYSFTTLVNRN